MREGKGLSNDSIAEPLSNIAGTIIEHLPDLPPANINLEISPLLILAVLAGMWIWQRHGSHRR
jgi:hypothetical protein